MKPLLAIALTLSVVCHLSHRALMASVLPDAAQSQRDTLPSADALHLMSLGYRNVVADYYWLRAISHFGDKSMHRYKYPNLGPLLDRVIALDPKFASAYILAGQTLSFTNAEPEVPLRMLKQGALERPDNWRIFFALGFEAYYLEGDYALASHALAQGAKLPGAPSYVGPFAARLAAEAGEPEVGLTFVRAMLQTEQDPALKATYAQREQLLLLEVALKTLNRAVAVYTERNKAPPAHLADLVKDHIMDVIPDDPLGGVFSLNAQHQVTTTHQEQRLRLRDNAKIKYHAPKDVPEAMP